MISRSNKPRSNKPRSNKPGSKTLPARKKPPAESDSANGGPNPQPPDRAALVRRMWSAADLQVREIEQRLRDETSPAPDDRERDARVLSVLARTLRELSELDAHNPDRETAPDDDDDAVPRDLDELRRSLARKLEALVAGSATDIPGEA